MKNNDANEYHRNGWSKALSTDRQNCKEVIILDHSQTNNTGLSLLLGLWDGLKFKCQTKNKFPDFQYGECTLNDQYPLP